MKSLAFAVGRNNQTFAGLHLQAVTSRLAQPGFWHAMKIGGRLLARGSPLTPSFYSLLVW
jgi:hypothetical protein